MFGLAMILIGIAIFLLPITLYFIFRFYNESRKLRGIYIADKYYGIDSVNFKDIPLRPIRKEIVTEDYEKTLVIFDVSSTKISSDQKMYTGANLGGIKLPFATAGFTSRKFYNKKGYVKYGESRLYLTNTSIRVYCYNEPFRWSVAIAKVVNANISGYGKSIELEVSWTGVNTTEIKERFVIDFLSTKEAIYFLNCLWTVNHRGWRYYRDLGLKDAEFIAYEDKTITRWDIKRIEKELKKYPELSDMSWQEIEVKLKMEKSMVKISKSYSPKEGEEYIDAYNHNTDEGWKQNKLKEMKADERKKMIKLGLFKSKKLKTKNKSGLNNGKIKDDLNIKPDK